MSADVVGPLECPECGGTNLSAARDSHAYSTSFACPDCGVAWEDADEDVYGPMSVPWGFLL